LFASYSVSSNQMSFVLPRLSYVYIGNGSIDMNYHQH